MRRRDAASLGLLLNAVGIGADYKSGNEDLVLVQDFDTVAYSRTESSGKSVIGWQFRPVLGNNLIMPGQRLLLAAISIPKSGEKKGEEPFLAYNVRITWRDYDAKLRTAGAIKCSYTSSLSKQVSFHNLRPRIVSTDIHPTAKPNEFSLRVQGNGFYKEMPFLLGAQSLQANFNGATVMSLTATGEGLRDSTLDVMDVMDIRRTVVGKLPHLRLSVPSIKFSEDRAILQVALNGSSTNIQRVFERLGRSFIASVGSHYQKVILNPSVAPVIKDANGKIEFPLNLPAAALLQGRNLTLFAPGFGNEADGPYSLVEPLARYGYFEITKAEYLGPDEDHETFAIYGVGSRGI